MAKKYNDPRVIKMNEEYLKNQKNGFLGFLQKKLDLPTIDSMKKNPEKYKGRPEQIQIKVLEEPVYKDGIFYMIGQHITTEIIYIVEMSEAYYELHPVKSKKCIEIFGVNNGLDFIEGEYYSKIVADSYKKVPALTQLTVKGAKMASKTEKILTSTITESFK